MSDEQTDATGGWRATILSLGAWWRHLVWFLAAVATGVLALFLHQAEKWSEVFADQVATVSPLVPFVLVSAGMVLICRLRDRFFRGTEGTGIPQAIAALKMPDGPARSRVLSLRIVAGKIFLLTLGLFAGATIGREGPSVHVGACIMHTVGRFARFPRHLMQRGLILSGGAAGIAAAFNAPIAGAVFAFEEIGRSFEKENGGIIVRTVAVACLVCIVVLSDYIFYGRVETGLQTLQGWAVVPVIGLVGGLLGGLFAQALVSLMPRYQRLAGHHPYLAAGGLGLTLGVLGLLSGGLTYGSGFPEAQHILVHGESYPAFFPFAKAAASFVSLLSGIPGGLFDPSLTVGAGLGQLITPVLSHMDRQAVVLLAMVSYFAGVVQSPLTAAVILLEMTGSRGMVLPLVTASVLAYEASHLVCRTSLYEALADIFLGRHG